MYAALQAALGSRKGRAALVGEYLRPRPGERVLDIGCGPGSLLESMPASVEYVGIDSSERYLRRARARFGDRAEFRHVDVREADPRAGCGFDLAIALGVLHHLDDSGAAALVDLASSALADGGRFVSADPTLLDGQGRAARWLIRRDRGRHVRRPEEYEAIVRRSFGSVAPTVREDLLRVPYAHAIMVCSPAPRQRT